MAERSKSNAGSLWGVIFVAVLAFAATYALYLYYQPDAPLAPAREEEARVDASDIQEEPLAEEDEADPVEEWVDYSDERIIFKYPSSWFIKEENDFITLTSWDPQVSPERGKEGLRLVIGHVRTAMSLEQYVSDYLSQNINFDPSFSLLARENSVLGGQPAIMVQSATTLEGGSVIQSIFALKDGELWSVDLIGKILNQDFEIIFNQVIKTFSFK